MIRLGFMDLILVIIQSFIVFTDFIPELKSKVPDTTPNPIFQENRVGIIYNRLMLWISKVYINNPKTQVLVSWLSTLFGIGITLVNTYFEAESLNENFG